MSNWLGLDDRVILVTGGASGIGKATAESIKEGGATVVIADMNVQTGDEIDGMWCVHCNVTDPDEVKAMVDAIVEKYGHIDGVVNNAGSNDNLELETTSWQDFEKSLHGNLTHYFELVHETCPYIKESKGSIVNIASKVALTGQGKTTAYAAAKGAILGLTREWAAALVHDSVRVNAIVVAEAWTPLYANWIKTFGDEEAQQKRLSLITDRIPLEHHMTSTEEIADTACFLLSDRSSHTTGQWCNVDGGYVNLDRALD